MCGGYSKFNNWCRDVFTDMTLTLWLLVSRDDYISRWKTSNFPPSQYLEENLLQHQFSKGEGTLKRKQQRVHRDSRKEPLDTKA